MKNMDLQIFAEPNVPSNPITPEINYETEAFINTSPAEGQPTWASLANLTTNMAQSLNEVIQQLTYYADKGWGSSEVTGAQLTLTLTGSVKPGDDACDYILSDDGEIQVTDEENALETKMENINNSILSKIVDRAG